MKEKPLSELVFERFSLYNRYIQKLYHEDNRIMTDSRELSSSLHIDPSLIRRDLSLLGKMGKRGMGYSIPTLKSKIASFLGKDKEWTIAIVGIGNLGKAIFRYLYYNPSNFIVKRLYDQDPAKIGQTLENIEITDFKNFSAEDQIDIGILTVPVSSAQSVADRLIEAGIKAILNFAPIKLSLSESVFYRKIDLIQELDVLTAMLVNAE